MTDPGERRHPLGMNGPIDENRRDGISWKRASSTESSFLNKFQGSSVGEAPATHTSHCPAASRDAGNKG